MPFRIVDEEKRVQELIKNDPEFEKEVRKAEKRYQFMKLLYQLRKYIYNG